MALPLPEEVVPPFNLVINHHAALPLYPLTPPITHRLSQSPPPWTPHIPSQKKRCSKPDVGLVRRGWNDEGAFFLAGFFWKKAILISMMLALYMWSPLSESDQWHDMSMVRSSGRAAAARSDARRPQICPCVCVCVAAVVSLFEVLVVFQNCD